MDYREALDTLMCRAVSDSYLCDAYMTRGRKVCLECKPEDAYHKLEELVDRAIPLEPIPLPHGGFGDMALSCPTCRKPIVNVWTSRTYNPKYCHYCGQRLDWRNENE